MIKLLLFAFGGFISLLAVLIFVGSMVLNNRFDKRPEAGEFVAGLFPLPALDGDYKGAQFTGLGKNWLGKHFTANKNNGINNFSSTTGKSQRYTFATSQQKGLRNKDVTLLQLDYNQPGNPVWLRFIKDEIVQTGPGKYLGKIHFKFGPIVITLGYFQLSK